MGRLLTFQMMHITFLIEDYDKLTPSQQTLLKRYIIKHQLDISLQHAILSSPLHSLNMIKKLETFC